MRVKYVLIPINISTFRFSPSKIFLQLLVLIKFSITTLVPIFKLIFVIFDEILQKYVKYCKKIEFFNKPQIKYEFLTVKNIKIHIKFMFC